MLNQPSFLLNHPAPHWTTSVALILIVVLLLLLVMPFLNQGLYHSIRTLYKAQQSSHLAQFKQAETPHFIYHYQDINPSSLTMIQQESEHIFQGVNTFFNFTPNDRIPVVIYPTSQTLNDSFGWEGDRSPMGVYWMGYIKILAPEAWIKGDQDDQAKIFQTIGPMAHEYSHYVIDWQTNGNYPRWFSEGLAQYVEQSLSYYTTKPPQAKDASLYDFAQLDKTFDSQVDQTLAYWQSLEAIHYLVDTYGQDILAQIITQLGKGKPFESILKNLTSHTYDSLALALTHHLHPVAPVPCASFF